MFSGARRIGYVYVEITKIREKYKVIGEYREGRGYFLWEIQEDLAKETFISH